MVVRVLAYLALMGTALMLVVGFGLAAYAAARGNRALLRRIALVAGGWVAAYLVLLGLTVATAPRRVLQPGDPLAFCGLDCHLHLAVSEVSRDSLLEVGLRLWSDARGAPEYPGLLRVRAVTSDGRAYRPVSGGLGGELPAGVSVRRRLRFASPPSETRLSISWGSWPDYLVLGPENAWAQQKTQVRLPTGAAPEP